MTGQKASQKAIKFKMGLKNHFIITTIHTTTDVWLARL